MEQLVVIKIKTYGCGSDLPETNVIFTGYSRQCAIEAIEKDYEDTIKYTSGGNHCFDGEDTYIVDDDNDNLYTYAIHKIDIK